MHSLWWISLLLAFGAADPRARDAAWVPVGPEGGNVRALVADSRTPRRVYLGTPDGLLYRSEDGGESWRRTSPGFPRRGCSLDKIAVDARGVLYVGFWEVDGKGGGVARSTDGGDTFTILKGTSGEPVRALAIAPGNARWIAAGTPTGVYLTRDEGRNWTRITPEAHADLRNIESLAFDPADARVLYAGTRHLAWKTTDAGASWSPIHDGMIDDSHVMTLNVDRENRDGLFATACTGIYQSSDAGTRWTKLGGIPDSSRRTRSFQQSPEDPDFLLAGTTEGLWISEDRGSTWRLATRQDLVINALVLEPGGTILLGTEEEGVMRSTDRGRTWTASNDGFRERFVTRIAFDRARDLVFAAVFGARPGGGMYVAPGVRGPWTRIGEGLEGRQVLSLALAGGMICAGTDEGIFVRDGRARHWSPARIRLAGHDVRPRVVEMVTLPGGRLLAGTSAGLVHSADNGRTWTQSALRDAGEVTALTVSPDDPKQVVVATRTGFFSTEDGGVTWRHPPARSVRLTPHALAFVPGSEGGLLAATTSGLYRSRDFGATWQAVGGGVPHSDLNGLVVGAGGREMFTSDFTHGGIFGSADGGATWTRLTTPNLPSDRVWMLAFDPERPDRLLAAPRAGGLHLLEAGTAAAVPVDAVEAAASAGGGSSDFAARGQRPAGSN